MPEVYLGNLPRDIRQDEILDFFRGFGPIGHIDIKAGFAFIQMDDQRDASDAVRRLDGTKFCGTNVTVDISKGKPTREELDRRDKRENSRDRQSDRYDNRDREFSRDTKNRDSRGLSDRIGGGGSTYNYRRSPENCRGNSRNGGNENGAGYAPRRDGHGPGYRGDGNKPQKTRFSLICKNLSSRAQWFDLKDLGRSVGDVTYADANKIREREGIMSFSSKEDMIGAYEKLNGKEFMGYDLKLEYQNPDMLRDTRDNSMERDRRDERTRRFDRSRSRSPINGRGRFSPRGRSDSRGRY